MGRLHGNVAIVIMVIMVVALFISGERARAYSIDELIEDLQSSDELKRIVAMEELRYIIDEKVINSIREAVFINSGRWKIKIEVIHFLGDIDDPLVKEFLIKILNDQLLNEACPAIQANTVISLGKKFNKGSKVVDELVKALNHHDIMVRNAVIKSLGEIGDSRAIPPLIERLKDRSFSIKFNTIQALERIGDINAIPYLRKMAANEHNKFIKEEALSALEKLSSRIIFTNNRKIQVMQASSRKAYNMQYKVVEDKRR